MRALHFTLVTLGGVLWVLAAVPFCLAAGLLVLAHRLWPDADRGNCWAYALPRWVEQGGYLVLRPVRDVRVFGLPIYHALWLRQWGGEVEHTAPIQRKTARWLGYFTFYFRYRVMRKEGS